MKLSIIIPVYRVEDTLDKCIESVVKQDFTDFEAILIDDGSPDRCPQKCDEWARKDTRISVIHKQNGGLSDARNAGLEIAKGDYITFVDADDFISAQTYAPLMGKLSERPDIDILEYPIYVFYNSKRQYRMDFKKEKEYHDMEEYWYEGQAYQHTYACNKIFRSTLFKEVRFPKGIIFEDVNTLPRLLERAKVVATTQQGMYYYCANPSGITATADGKGLQMLLQSHVDIISKTQRDDVWFQRYYMHVLNIQMDVYEQTGAATTLPKVTINAKTLHGLQQMKAVALNILGINRLCKLNKTIHKIWRNH